MKKPRTVTGKFLGKLVEGQYVDETDTHVVVKVTTSVSVLGEQFTRLIHLSKQSVKSEDKF